MLYYVSFNNRDKCTHIIDLKHNPYSSTIPVGIISVNSKCVCYVDI